ESASGSTSGGDVVAAADHSGHGGDGGLTAEEMDQMMIDSMLAFPAETEGRGNQLLEPTEIREDGTKVYDITASIIDWEVSPGQFIDGWAYNEQIPGPRIRAVVGDQLELNVTKETAVGHAVHGPG